MKLKRALLSAVSALGLIGASVSIANSAVPPPTQGTLPGYHLGSVYVTGLSSGGFLANQLHVAYSGIFQGAGIFSAGPYDCANNSLITALYGCMATWAGHRTPAQLEQLTRTRASAGSIDPAGNLSGDPVWLYHGTSDRTVATSVNDDLATYYRDLGANVKYERTSTAGHAWVSPIGSNPCAATSSPYVNDCGDDPVTAGAEVIVFGPGDQGEPTADDWAAACGTINYEIVTRIGPRVPRRYVGSVVTSEPGGAS
jgi:hypothetical protein